MIETTPLGQTHSAQWPVLLDADTPAFVGCIDGRIKCPSKHVAFDVGTSTQAHWPAIHPGDARPGSFACFWL